MKVKSLISLSMLLAAQAISAASVQSTPLVPLLEKIDASSGEILPAAFVSKNCVIYQNGTMVKRYTAGTLSSTRRIALKIETAKIKAIIDKAAAALVTYNPLSATTLDGPMLEYYAYQKQADGSLKKVLLWLLDISFQYSASNVPDDAHVLRNFIDLNCDNQLVDQ